MRSHEEELLQRNLQILAKADIARLHLCCQKACRRAANPLESQWLAALFAIGFTALGVALRMELQQEQEQEPQ